MLRLLSLLFALGFGAIGSTPQARAAPASQFPPVPPQVSTDARRLLDVVDRVQGATVAGDWATTRSEWHAFDDLWFEVEDGFRAVSRQDYRDIESTMRRVTNALQEDSPSADVVISELATLRAQIAPFLGDTQSQAPMPVAAVANQGGGGLHQLMAILDGAIAAAQRGDAAVARREVEQFQNEWLEVEGQVKTRSPGVYRSTEDGMTEAAAMLKGASPRVREAADVLERMRNDLKPIAEQTANYGVADAAIILLREGLEALLVVAALLAFLTKAGQADKQRWVWGGAAAGIAVSVVVAFVLQRVFTSAAAGVNRELLEGITGLAAAGMLIYVSYWLHSKASLSAWHRYIHDKAASALAGGGLLSLATISFLAVFREGAETVLFYAGIAPAIDVRDLALGLGLGTGGLIVAGVVLVGFGVRIPIRPFFMVSSLLLYYLAFKFIGTGFHALQVASLISATPAPVPPVEAIGLFPTWETTLPQLALIGATLGVLVQSEVRVRSTRRATARVA